MKLITFHNVSAGRYNRMHGSFVASQKLASSAGASPMSAPPPFLFWKCWFYLKVENNVNSTCKLSTSDF